MVQYFQKAKVKRQEEWVTRTKWMVGGGEFIPSDEEYRVPTMYWTFSNKTDMTSALNVSTVKLPQRLKRK